MIEDERTYSWATVHEDCTAPLGVHICPLLEGRILGDPLARCGKMTALPTSIIQIPLAVWRIEPPTHVAKLPASSFLPFQFRLFINFQSKFCHLL